jgi:hypothetical protein
MLVLVMGRAMAGVGRGAGDDLKSSWPEVVGWDVIPAGIKIYTERPDISFEFHTVGDNVAPGHYDHRVRLFVTAGTTTIARTPVVG